MAPIIGGILGLILMIGFLAVLVVKLMSIPLTIIIVLTVGLAAYEFYTDLFRRGQRANGR